MVTCNAISSKLPAPASNQVYVSISALEGGHLTLPERLFVTDADPEKRSTVPSLSFLIRHPSARENGKTPTNVVFDLGMRRDITKFKPAQQTHIQNRQPTIVHPDVADSLRAGGLSSETDIDIVILSHVHWDHVGTPEDFSNAKFIVGSGTLHLLEHGAPPNWPVDYFISDLLPSERTFELPPASSERRALAATQQTQHTWKSLANFEAAVDFFGDGSLYIIDSPGHLYGHVNLLARIAQNRWVYLGGDCCHDYRILTGEKGMAYYDDGHGGMRTVHVDAEAAKRTLERISPYLHGKMGSEFGDEEVDQVEVIVAHDGGWRTKNLHRFYPGTL